MIKISSDELPWVTAHELSAASYATVPLNAALSTDEPHWMLYMLMELSSTMDGYSKVTLMRTVGVLTALEMLDADDEPPNQSWDSFWGVRTPVPPMSTFGGARGRRVTGAGAVTVVPPLGITVVPDGAETLEVVVVV